MKYCINCGQELAEEAKFCANCGKAVSAPQNGINEQRKIVYEGHIHKCPNCGEVLQSFVANCPACGYEIRDTYSVSFVREFAMKLEQIETQKMPAFEGKKSVMKMVFGRDSKMKMKWKKQENTGKNRNIRKKQI